MTSVVRSPSASSAPDQPSQVDVTQWARALGFPHLAHLRENEIECVLEREGDGMRVVTSIGSHILESRILNEITRDLLRSDHLEQSVRRHIEALYREWYFDFYGGPA